MPLKLKILEIVKGQRVVDQGAASEHTEDTYHVWVEEPKPRRFKINLAKATASDLNVIVNNVGAVLLMDIGEMVQQNSHALYLKPGYDIDVLIPALESAIIIEPIIFQPVVEPTQLKPQEPKTELPESTISPIVETKGVSTNRPPQQTR